MQKSFSVEWQRKQRDNLKEVFLTQNAPKPIGSYNQAVQAGNLLFVSGQLAIEPKNRKLIAKNIILQTYQVLENPKLILEAASYSLRDVVQSAV